MPPSRCRAIIFLVVLRYVSCDSLTVFSSMLYSPYLVFPSLPHRRSFHAHYVSSIVSATIIRGTHTPAHTPVFPFFALYTPARKRGYRRTAYHVRTMSVVTSTLSFCKRQRPNRSLFEFGGDLERSTPVPHVGSNVLV